MMGRGRIRLSGGWGGGARRRYRRERRDVGRAARLRPDGREEPGRRGGGPMGRPTGGSARPRPRSRRRGRGRDGRGVPGGRRPAAPGRARPRAGGSPGPPRLRRRADPRFGSGAEGRRRRRGNRGPTLSVGTALAPVGIAVGITRGFWADFEGARGSWTRGGRSACDPQRCSISSLEGVARVTGLEPATTGSTVRYSNQLSYTPARCQRRCVVVVSRTRGVGAARSERVGDAGFEPATPSL